VFESSDNGKLSMLKEFLKFIAARIFSGLFDTASMMILVNLLAVNDMVAKILVNILVVVINYVLSKWIIFK